MKWGRLPLILTLTLTLTQPLSHPFSATYADSGDESSNRLRERERHVSIVLVPQDSHVLWIASPAFHCKELVGSGSLHAVATTLLSPDADSMGAMGLG